jgi:hypothetical protein
LIQLLLVGGTGLVLLSVSLDLLNLWYVRLGVTSIHVLPALVGLAGAMTLPVDWTTKAGVGLLLVIVHATVLYVAYRAITYRQAVRWLSPPSEFHHASEEGLQTGLGFLLEILRKVDESSWEKSLLAFKRWQSPSGLLLTLSDIEALLADPVSARDYFSKLNMVEGSSTIASEALLRRLHHSLTVSPK